MIPKVRTRFAPSPTGALHVGNVRVAVFNWLFARHLNGAFTLRLEDTDVERNVPGAEEALMKDLLWLGLEWDEGPDRGGAFGPYRQSERADLYRSTAVSALEKGWAYPCFCSDDVLAADEVQMESGVRVNRYPGRCRRLAPDERRLRMDAGEEYLIRFHVPPGDITFRDEIRGPITFPGRDFDDFVLLRRDGTATYNFAVVVDDVGMEVSDVIRGAGHLSNTPKQVLLYQALGAPAPRFTHLPTVLGADRKKLSKRSGASAVADLRAEGYHPDAVVNYLSLLGWSDPEGREFLTRAELIQSVGLDRLGASDTVFDPEKMRWLSQSHFGLMDPAAFAEAALPFVDVARFPQDRHQLGLALVALQSRIAVLSEADDFLGLVFPEDPAAIERVRASLAREPGVPDLLRAIGSSLSSLEEWEAGPIGKAVREVGKEMNIRGPALFHPVRRALNGLESGPDLGSVMVAWGREATLAAYEETLGHPDL